MLKMYKKHVITPGLPILWGLLDSRFEQKFLIAVYRDIPLIQRLEYNNDSQLSRDIKRSSPGHSVTNSVDLPGLRVVSGNRVVQVTDRERLLPFLEERYRGFLTKPMEDMPKFLSEPSALGVIAEYRLEEGL
jgi:hypothetical protein